MNWKKGFRNGIKLEDRKEATKDSDIEEFFEVEKLEIFLKQHIGKPSIELVKKGDFVKKGDCIADSGINIHSPISGKVIEITEKNHPIYGKQKIIILENDGLETLSVEYEKREENYMDLSIKKLKEIISDKGIVGLGGATFPSIRKLSSPKRADYLIVNAAECEPYLNIDNRLIIEKTKSLIEGIKIVEKILEAEKVIIGIEDNKKEAIECLEKLKKDSFEIKIVETRYPQGGEKQVIQSITGREVQSAGLPIDIGIVVFNVGTLIAIYEAVALGKPLIEKEITVAGDCIKDKKNLRVKIGSSVRDILTHTGYKEAEIAKLILGGPMMGKAIESADMAITKGVGGVLALGKKEAKAYKSRACILCGKCVYVCPMGLSPLQFVKYTESRMLDKLKEYRLNDCINCGSCSYICPSNRPLMEGIMLGKDLLRGEQNV